MDNAKRHPRVSLRLLGKEPFFEFRMKCSMSSSKQTSSSFVLDTPYCSTQQNKKMEMALVVYQHVLGADQQ
jgi:hypothetical protein